MKGYVEARVHWVSGIGYCSLLFQEKAISLPLLNDQYSIADSQWDSFPRRTSPFRVYEDALSLIVFQMRRAGGARGGVGVNHMK